MAHAMTFTAWCLGSDKMNNATGEAFGCENLARGGVLLDCGATDTVRSVEAIEAILDTTQEGFGTDPDWVSVDTNDRPAYKFGDTKRKQALSKVQMKVQPGGHVAHFLGHAQETKRSACAVVCQVTDRVGCSDQRRGHAIFRNLKPETVVQLDRSPTGHLWMDLFEQMPVLSENSLSLLGQSKPGAKIGFDVAKFNSARSNPENTVSLKSPFNLKKSGTINSEDGIRENRAHVARRGDGLTGPAGMGTSYERGIHTSRKEKHLARTRGESDAVRV